MSEKIIVGKGGRFPEEQTVISRGKPDARGRTLIRVRDSRGVTMTHRFNPDGTVSYYNWRDE